MSAQTLQDYRVGDGNYVGVIADSSHQLAALKLRKKQTATELEENFAALGAEVREFHLQLLKQPVKAIVHVRRIVELARLYGRESVIASIRVAIHYQIYDAAYVELSSCIRHLLLALCAHPEGLLDRSF